MQRTHPHDAGQHVHSKTDQRDAQAIAQYVWREGATLPLVTAEDEAVVLEVLVTQRNAPVVEATRLRNQAHQLLLQCDPAYQTHQPVLRTEAGIAALEGYHAPGPVVVAQARACAIRLLGQCLRLAVAQAAELEAQIEARAGFPLSWPCASSARPHSASPSAVYGASRVIATLPGAAR